MSEAPFVALHGVTRQWNGAGGVEGVSLAVARGAFVSILGPSGCGKSTLLRLLAGLETPQEGRIEIAGRDVTARSPAERGLSMVFQSYALFPHLNVRENILFGMKVRRATRAEREEALARATAMTGLEGLERRKPAELSGGQRQRVALARAVVSGHRTRTRATSPGVGEPPTAGVRAARPRATCRMRCSRPIGISLSCGSAPNMTALAIADVSDMLRRQPPNDIFQVHQKGKNVIT
jgi:ABC-type uncharacterized transport system YnjBCD ATPase subunit